MFSIQMNLFIEMIDFSVNLVAVDASCRAAVRAMQWDYSLWDVNVVMCCYTAEMCEECTRVAATCRCPRCQGNMCGACFSRVLSVHQSIYHSCFPRPELTGDQFPLPGPSTRLVETYARQHGQCWRVMETGHPSTRAVNSGRQLE